MDKTIVDQLMDEDEYYDSPITDGTFRVICPTYDTMVYIEKSNGRITGLNIMWGMMFEPFLNNYCIRDEMLTHYYIASLPYEDNPELDFINEVALEYINYRDLLEKLDFDQYDRLLDYRRSNYKP